MLRALVVVVIAALPVGVWAQPAAEEPSAPSPETGSAGTPAPPADAAPVVEPATPPAQPAEATAPETPAAPVGSTTTATGTTPAEPNKFPMGWRLMLSDLSLFRLNPIGLETRIRLGIQKKLYASDKKLTENNFMFLGAFPRLNPASAMFSLGGEIQPASIFNLRTFVEVQQYFGTFGFLQSFGSANTANYSDNNLAELKDNPSFEPQAKVLKHFSIQPMLQLKLGKVAIRALLQLDYWDFNLRGTSVYEPTFDTLLPRKSWTMSTDTDVLYVTGTGLTAGLRHTYVKPFYNSDHFDDAADEAAYDGQNGHQRLGFFGAYTFKDKGPSIFNKATAILIVSFYINHKYRAGEPDMLDPGHTSDDYRTRAFPYFLAGFAFESDFLRIRER